MSSPGLLYSIAWIVVVSCCGGSFAQDELSQRLLPLPDSGVTNLPQHMEMLKRLRSLIESQQNAPLPTSPQAELNKVPESDSGGSLQPEQFQQLQDALKDLTDKLPPGFVPPNLSNIPPEQLQKAMENPAVQQQMRNMLKQFSKDGILPHPQSGADSSPLPLPRLPSPSGQTELNSDKSDDRQESDGTEETNEDGKKDGDPSSKTPQGSMKSLHEFLKKLYDGSDTQPPAEETTDQKSSVPSRDSAMPRQPLRRRDREKEQTNPNPKSTKSRNGDRPVPPLPLPPEPPAIGNSQKPQTDTSRNPSPSELTPRPGLNPLQKGSNESNSASNTDSLDQDSPEPYEMNSPGSDRSAESARLQMEELQKTIEKLKELSLQSSKDDGTETPKMPSIDSLPVPIPNNQSGRSRNSLRTPSPNRSSSPSSETGNPNRSSDSESPGSLPDISEFLKEQLKNFKLPPDTQGGPDSPDTLSDSQASRDRSASPSPSPIPMPEQNGRLSMPANPLVQRSSEKSSQALDIRKELERRGFGETLKKIVERAKEESRRPKAPVDGTAGSDSSGMNGSQSNPQLSDSMVKMLDGLKGDLVEIAKDAKFNDPPRQPERTRNLPRDASNNSGSMLDGFRKSASELLAGPTSPSANRPSGSSATSVSSGFPDSQFDFTPVLVLAGLLAIAGLGFFGMRYLKLQASSAAALQFSGPAIQPSEIQNRADVIRAFHEFAMRSTKSVQSWWTHRAVQRVIAASAPDKQVAVETLANAYEQARYLPLDHELSADQIQSARNALKQCTTSAS